MKKFRNVVAAVIAALMVVGMMIGGGTTAFAAGSSTMTDEYTLEVSYETKDGTKVGSYYVSSDYYLFTELTEDLALEGMPDGYEFLSAFDANWTYTSVGITVLVKAVDTTDTGSTESGSTTEDTTGSTTEETTGTTTETTEATVETTEATEVVENDSDYIDDLVTRIHLASVDGTGTVEVTNLATLPIEVMQALKDCGNVSLTSTFIYNDTEYTITIPAGKAIVYEDIQWYGPMWLNAHYGQGTTTTTTKSGSTYTVVSGDNLSLIAAEHDMGLAELVAKNPQITNINLILPGQVINL